MNRKSFLKTLGGIFALPFVTPAMTVAQQTLDKMPKPVQKQTAVEQKKLEKFYNEPKYAVSGNYATGVYMFSGVMPRMSITGSYMV